MRVAFDSVVLGAYCHPDARYPRAVPHVRKRLEYLVTTLEEERATIVIPTPALSEFLVLAGNEGPSYLEALTGNRVFELAPFDVRAAVEAAEAEVAATESGDKKATATGSWQKIKVDRQIVAIAKVWDVERLYSEDRDVLALAKQMGVAAYSAADLALPPEDPQRPLFSGEEE